MGVVGWLVGLCKSWSLSLEWVNLIINSLKELNNIKRDSACDCWPTLYNIIDKTKCNQFPLNVQQTVKPLNSIHRPLLSD